MSWSLRNKLIISFVGVTILSIIIAAFLANQGIKKEFSYYLEKRQENYIHNLTKALADGYQERGGWDNNLAYLAIRSGFREGYIVALTDKNRQLVWHLGQKSSKPKKRILQKLLSERRHLLNTYPITVEGQVVGYLEVQALGKSIRGEQDKFFLMALNKSLYLSALIGVFFALLLSLIISNNLSWPINKLMGIARKLKEGDLGVRFKERTSTIELNSLAASLNSLASTLEEQDMLRKRLTADLAHELRTPLAALQSHLEALIDGIWEITPEKLEGCHQEVLRLSRLIADLEQLNQFEQKMVEPQLERIDLKPLVENIVVNYIPQYEVKGVKLELIGDKEIFIMLDRDRFTQVMVNLLSNALKFTPQGGLVQVEIESKKGQAIIRVEDSGEGIAPEDIKHIFQRLYRGDKSRSKGTGGTGIGLAITKALVQAQGGIIKVESQLGKGTVFTINFPQVS